MTKTFVIMTVGLGVVWWGLEAGFRDLVSEEMRTRLERVPDAMLRRAAMLLPREERLSTYRDQWLPDLLYLTRETEGLPITRLIRSVKFALGLCPGPGGSQENGAAPSVES